MNYKELFQEYPGLYVNDVASRDMNSEKEINVVFNVDHITYSSILRPEKETADSRLLQLGCLLKGVISQPGSYSYTPGNMQDFFMVIYTIDGCGEAEMEGRRYLLKKGDGIVVHCLHYFHLCVHGDSPWIYDVIMLQGEAAKPFIEKIHRDKSYVAHFHNRMAMPAFIQTLSNACAVPDNEGFDIHCALTELLGYFVRSDHAGTTDTKTDRYKEIKQYLEQNYNRPVSLEELEDAFHISRWHLCKMFKKYYDMTPAEYHSQIRIKIVKQLLLTSDMTVAQISEKLGYSYTHHMIRIFKASEGVTPLAYRKVNGVNA